MSKRYDEIMEHIEVTPEMHDRIMSSIGAMDFGEKKQAKVIHFPNLKHLATLAACLAVTLVGVLALPNLRSAPNDPVVDESHDIVEVSSIEELSDTVGFKVNEPSGLPFEAKDVIYTAYWTEIAEITYMNSEQTAVFRKGIGTEDISGDYNSYELTEEVSVGGISVTLKGSNDTYALAIWTDGAFAYSLSLSENISEAEWISMVQTIK